MEPRRETALYMTLYHLRVQAVEGPDVQNAYFFSRQRAEMAIKKIRKTGLPYNCTVTEVKAWDLTGTTAWLHTPNYIGRLVQVQT
jgi:hypothetical protein